MIVENNDRARWLQGPSAACSVPPAATNLPWRLVLLGAPGVGKGTQADLLTKRLGACHLSTGDVFRAAAQFCDCDKTPAIREAQDFMKNGSLVPDTTVWEMVHERGPCLNCCGGFILDGFPRTLMQAELLRNHMQSEQLQLTAVINYELPLDEIVARLSGRRTCEKCRAVYHVSGNPPKQEGICDRCQGKLIQREDDRPEAIKVRMAAYTASTAPLIDFYRGLGLLVSVPATGTPEEIFDRTLKALTGGPAA